MKFKGDIQSETLLKLTSHANVVNIMMLSHLLVQIRAKLILLLCLIWFHTACN